MNVNSDILPVYYESSSVHHGTYHCMVQLGSEILSSLPLKLELRQGIYNIILFVSILAG